MTESQMRAMIELHRKAEKAFRQYGKTADADSAKRLRMELEAKLEKTSK